VSDGESGRNSSTVGLKNAYECLDSTESEVCTPEWLTHFKCESIGYGLTVKTAKGDDVNHVLLNRMDIISADWESVTWKNHSAPPHLALVSCKYYEAEAAEARCYPLTADQKCSDINLRKASSGKVCVVVWHSSSFDQRQVCMTISPDSYNPHDMIARGLKYVPLIITCGISLQCLYTRIRQSGNRRWRHYLAQERLDYEAHDLEEVLLLGEHNNAEARDSFLEKMDALFLNQQKTKWTRVLDWNTNTMQWQFGSGSNVQGKGEDDEKPTHSPTNSVSSLSSLWSMASGNHTSDLEKQAQDEHKKKINDLLHGRRGWIRSFREGMLDEKDAAKAAAGAGEIDRTEAPRFTAEGGELNGEEKNGEEKNEEEKNEEAMEDEAMEDEQGAEKVVEVVVEQEEEKQEEEQVEEKQGKTEGKEDATGGDLAPGAEPKEAPADAPADAPAEDAAAEDAIDPMDTETPTYLASSAGEGAGAGAQLDNEVVPAASVDPVIAAASPPRTVTLTMEWSEAGVPDADEGDSMQPVCCIRDPFNPPPTPSLLRELESVMDSTFSHKFRWFRQQCRDLILPWQQGHERVCIHRDTILEDSFTRIMSLEPAAMRKIFRFEFIGEQALDSGGLTREWYEVVSKQLFNVDNGLFQFTLNDSVTYQINPFSAELNDLHLNWFHFAGRLVGKALLDGQTISSFLSLPYLKVRPHECSIFTTSPPSISLHLPRALSLLSCSI
jgi:hypothetical protein